MAELEENTTNLIVNYLPQSLTDEEFRGMFLSVGQIKSSKVVRDKATGYSYGFGFVNFESPEDAQKAIETLNGLQIQNKTIKVALSREGRDVKNANVYVTGVPRSMTADELRDVFMEHGEVIQCRILTEQSGQSKGVGFILYDNKKQAEEAIAMKNGQLCPGGIEPMVVKFAEDNRGKAGRLAAQQGSFQQASPTGFYGAGGGGGSGSGGGGRGFGGYFGGGGGGYQGGYGPMRGRGAANQRFNPIQGNGYGNGNFAASGGMGDGPGGHILFVYNIGTDADERTLWQLFSPFGAVTKVNVIKDHQKNLCKGYGFVTMTNYNEACTAISNLNGQRHPGSGKPLQVSFKK